MTKEQDIWKLTISFWEDAAAAGVAPVRCDGYWGKDLEYYRAHEFFFQHPPSREDWWRLCDETPWMSAYDHRRACIDRHPWPLILPGKKACGVALRDEQGREIGRIDVCRESIRLNAYVQMSCVGVRIWQAIARGFRREMRDRIEGWVMVNEHVIVEEAMKQAANGGVTDALLIRIGKTLAHEACSSPRQEVVA